ncbi:MAG TPA: DUF2950 family protein [Candidatus Eremiobacteraceae bacterium]|nr:DUF2950 family protein [Candidatus Eremiobacteraceae bacterium]
MATNAKSRKWKQAILAVVAVLALVIVVVRTTAKAKGPMTFQTPEEAGKALDQAAKNGNQATLTRILGGETKALLLTGDKDADKGGLDKFTSKYQQMNRWVEMSDGSRVLYIGADNFAFPVPLAKNESGRWYFDGVAGAEELRAREVGRNELLAIDACAAMANAEQIYAEDYSQSGEYAQRIISTAGNQDGLYWPVSQGEAPSPLGNLNEFAKSSLTSVSPDQPLVIDGYTFRILTAQGDEAPGGAVNYMVDGKMSGGFAILATPVKYGETGIMTFMTGPNGVVYERDLGPDSVKIAESVQDFNPTDDWSLIE